MSRLACMRNAALLERRAQGLSSADALRLEEHLERCEGCARDAALLDGLRGLTDELPQALPQARRELAIEGALAQALQAQAPQGQALAAGAPVVNVMPGLRPRRASFELRRPALALGGLALAAAAAALLVIGRPWGGQQAQGAATRPAATTSPARGGDRVLRGEVEIDGQPGGRDAALSARATLRATQPATIALAHATLALSVGTTLRWDRAALRVQLEQGGVTADVDPGAQRRFSVQTARFTVLVLGTRFTVTEDGVSVERGKVRVLAPDGAVLVPALTAGERFAAPEPSAAAATDASGHTAARETATSDGDDGTDARRPVPTDPQARALLARARAQLAAGDAQAARGTVDTALALALARGDRAEALSLRAECALVAGDLGGAIDGYLRVSRVYANLPAGQNALFAAARLQAERGQKAAAVALLQRYLARHPRGRFVHEARRRLAELAPQTRSAP